MPAWTAIRRLNTTGTRWRLPGALRPRPGYQRRDPGRQQRAAHRRHRLGGRASRRACRWGHALDAARGHGGGAFGVIGPGLTRRAPMPPPTSSRGSREEAAKHGGFYHARALPARRSVPGSLPRGDRNRDGAARGPPTSPTSIIARPSRARRTRCWSWSTARAAGQDVTFDAYPYEWASTGS